MTGEFEADTAVSPSSPLGRALLAGLFDAVSGSARPEFTAWRRLFGHTAGIRTDKLHRLLGPRHGADLPAWLFALHSAIALMAKLTAAAALPGVAARLADAGRPVAERLRWLDSGEPFAAAGIENFPGADGFGWITDEAALAPVLAPVIAALARPGSRTGDLFTGIYQSFVPRELRHALGEVYTPPALAAYALDRIGWQPADDLLDPTCGTGTFLLEALRRRLAAAVPPSQALTGLYGIDLNPMAVLAAKASLVVALAPHLDPARPLRLPVWQGDALDQTGLEMIPRVSHLCGNPPWVKLSQLPPEYALAIKPLCARLGVLGDDRYVGGIETDLSIAITQAALTRWLQPGGRLAFYITASVFATASGQGFRRFALPDPPGPCRVLAVEDFKALAPFDGVNTHAALLLLEAAGPTVYPVPYLVHEAAGIRPLLAQPVPGSRDGPWLKGSAAQHALWQQLFDGGSPGAYRARKGVTTDRNGIYFVSVTQGSKPGFCSIANDPALGRSALARVSTEIEDTHLFPLLRGRGLSPFRATPDPVFRVIVPQRGMHGDPELPRTCPQTHAYLSRFETELVSRGSFRRYQPGQPFWSCWSTGAYSFSPWKVLWREIASRFCAAYLGPVDDPVLGHKVAVPDHKLYFVPVDSEDEAAFLTGLLNAPAVVEAVSAYAATLNLGTSVIETLRIPRFDPATIAHRALSALARDITRAGGTCTPGQTETLDRLALGLFGAL